jgi:hypothetical protein
MPSLRARPTLTPQDYEQCYALWGVLGQPYEQEFRDEHQIILDYPHKLSLVVTDGEEGPLAGIVVAVFVSDDFYLRCASSSEPFVMRHLRRCHGPKSSPLLDSRSIARANSGEGLNLMVIDFGICPNNGHGRGKVFEFMLRKYSEEYLGYKLKRVFAEPNGPEHYQHLVNQGYQVVNDYAAYRASNPRAPQALVAIDRSRALNGHDYFMGRLFVYNDPRCGFTRAQQELLQEAIKGGTDVELAQRLGVGYDAIKPRWRGVYQRIAAAYPDLLPAKEAEVRGSERRRVAIAFAREHPEELRPTSPVAKPQT